MPRKGFEPSRPKRALAPQASASASSATWACQCTAPRDYRDRRGGPSTEFLAVGSVLKPVTRERPSPRPPLPALGWHRRRRLRPAATGAPAPEVNFPPHLMLGKFNTFTTFNRPPTRLPHGAGGPLGRAGDEGTSWAGDRLLDATWPSSTALFSRSGASASLGARPDRAHFLSAENAGRSAYPCRRWTNRRTSRR